MLVLVTVESGGGHGFWRVSFASLPGDSQSLPVVSCRICLRHHHHVLRIILNVRYSIGDLMVSECQRADPIVEEVALVIESAQCPLVRLHEREKMVICES